ncbi:MAG: B12-binding domain-containing radical SAM protein [Proteobacteria bacterium]|nr:B12-binding domain-containing radical SAM protein [Pseudomonadota bacterium]MBU1708553.1 B12-binding domain-containing radical SAM protein [Pseudomonadota bacterium]
MKKIVLICPAYGNKLLENVRVLALPPLNLGLLAAHTPKQFDVRIVDEAMEDIDFDTPADLVGITCMTPMAPRAYEIATEFRNRGVPVVLGGIHASMLPEEAERFADAVVVGEGEEIWPQVLADFEKGTLQKRYTAKTRPDITFLPAPRRELFAPGYFVQTVQTSRGCPHNCKFCSVTLFNGGQCRLRDIDTVIDEINAIKDKRLFIIDDNIIGSGKKYIDRAFKLFDRLKDTKKQWGGQTCLNIVEHDGLLKAAAASGAKAFLIGFESIQEETLSAYNKNVNLRPTTKNFKEAIKKIHDHGIAIVGGFMFGADDHTSDTFKRTLDFIMDAQVDAVQLSIQTPLPGTALYKQLEDEGRILLNDYPKDWDAYNIFEPVFQPKHMTPEELYSGLVSAYETVSSFRTSLFRGVRTFIKTKSLFSTGISFFWNYDSYKTITKITRPRIYNTQ